MTTLNPGASPTPQNHIVRCWVRRGEVHSVLAYPGSRDAADTQRISHCYRVNTIEYRQLITHLLVDALWHAEVCARYRFIGQIAQVVRFDERVYCISQTNV